MLLADVSIFGFEADMGLVVTVTGVVVAGFAAVLGIWMERDDTKPPRYAYALSALILLATLVSVAQSYLDSKETDQIKDDMARLLQRMDDIAASSDNPELLELVKSELTAQSRSNPEVVEKLAQRVSDEGKDPTALLAKHLDASEVEAVSRKSRIKPKNTESVAKDAVGAPDEAAAKAAAARAAAAQQRGGRPMMPGRVVPGSEPAAEGETPTADAVAAPVPVLPTAADPRAARAANAGRTVPGREPATDKEGEAAAGKAGETAKKAERGKPKAETDKTEKGDKKKPTRGGETPRKPPR